MLRFDGRIPRRIYWGIYLLTTLSFVVLISIIMLVFGEESTATNIAILILYVPLIWITFVNQIKRWHDRDKSGKWVLINFIPMIGPIWTFLECGCCRGTVGPNRFGPDPT